MRVNACPFFIRCGEAADPLSAETPDPVADRVAAEEWGADRLESARCYVSKRHI